MSEELQIHRRIAGTSKGSIKLKLVDSWSYAGFTRTAQIQVNRCGAGTVELFFFSLFVYLEL